MSMMARLHRQMLLAISHESHIRFQGRLGVINDGNQVDESTSREFHMLGSSRDATVFHSIFLHSILTATFREKYLPSPQSDSFWPYNDI
jgi:hypothetical protein